MTVNIDQLSQVDLFQYIVDELYSSISKNRDMFKVSKLFRDDAAEAAIKEYMDTNDFSVEKLNEILQKVKNKI